MAREGRGRSRQYTAPTMPRVFLPFQHPKLVATPPAGEKWSHEIKFDGYRVQLHVHAGAATIFTRNGHDWTAKFPELAADLAALPDCILDGELCALDGEGRPSFSKLRASISPGRTKGLVIFLFDVLWGQGEDMRPYGLLARRHVLAKMLGSSESPRLREVGSLPTGGPAILTSACKMGLEGIVSKRVDGTYGTGRVDTWVKAKCRPSQEVVIGGWKQEPGRALKGLLVGIYERGQLTYAGSIKNGFGADRTVMARLRALETDASPFTAGAPPRKTSEIHWVRPELVAAAEIAEWTDAGKLRQASFKGLREDKTPEEVVREK